MDPRASGAPRPPVPPSRPAPPRLLDPILVAWERLDRRRRHIRPARAGAVLGLELRRHQGPDVVLGDDAMVRPGDLIGELHVDNVQARALAAGTGWLDGLRIGRSDLDAIAHWAAGRPPPDRPVAYHADGLLWPFAARVGFTVHSRRRTPRVWLGEWYFRWLLGHWSATGQPRLRQGHGQLRSADSWISAAALERRFGGPRRCPGAASRSRATVIGPAPGSPRSGCPSTSAPTRRVEGPGSVARDEGGE